MGGISVWWLCAFGYDGDFVLIWCAVGWLRAISWVFWFRMGLV